MNRVGTQVLARLEFLGGRSYGDPEIDDWIFYLPQVRSTRLPWPTAVI